MYIVINYIFNKINEIVSYLKDQLDFFKFAFGAIEMKETDLDLNDM